jgi:hypothetical protein
LLGNMPAEQRGPKRGFIEEATWMADCLAISLDVRAMDAILSGIIWRIVREPDAAEWIAMTPGGHPYYAWKSTPQPSAPVPLVVEYWDDGVNLHGTHVQRGEDASAETAP